MKIKIEYKADIEGVYAFTYYREQYISAYSRENAQIAKERLIARIREIEKKQPTIIPEPEEVELCI